MVQAFSIAIAIVAIAAPVLGAPAHRPHGRHHALHPREYDVAVEARSLDFANAGPLDVRDPFSLKKAFRKIGKVAKTVGGIATKAAPLAPLLLLREVQPDLELELRAYEQQGPFVGQIYIRDEDGFLYVRELDEAELSGMLEGRDPFSLKKVLRKGIGAVKKGLGVAQTVSGVVGQLGLREIEEGMLDELD